uniref:Uncharacterized protein n=1 Tax=viral metagenome TaxID=1070528 RepID=A0A6M3JZR1_9ZZZZ
MKKYGVYCGLCKKRVKDWKKHTQSAEHYKKMSEEGLDILARALHLKKGENKNESITNL